MDTLKTCLLTCPFKTKQLCTHVVSNKKEKHWISLPSLSFNVHWDTVITLSLYLRFTTYRCFDNTHEVYPLVPTTKKKTSLLDTQIKTRSVAIKSCEWFSWKLWLPKIQLYSFWRCYVMLTFIFISFINLFIYIYSREWRI